MDFDERPKPQIRDIRQWSTSTRNGREFDMATARQVCLLDSFCQETGEVKVLMVSTGKFDSILFWS